jgi:hypothetical protein
MALTGAQRDAAALAIARGQQVKLAAKETGVGLRTLHRWLTEDQDFRRRVGELRDELFSEAVGRLSDLAGLAADTLGDLLDSNDEKVRLQACRAVLDCGIRLREAAEWQARVAAIEVFLEERGPHVETEE